MIQISIISFSKFLNQEHYDFFVEVDELIQQETPVKLGIGREYSTFSACLAREAASLGFIRKNSFSEPSKAAIAKTESVLSGMSDYIDSCKNHFDPDVKESSARINLLWTANRNARSKKSKTRDGAIRKLLQEFRGVYAADVEKTAMGGWVNALEAAFNNYLGIDASRQTENANKSPLRMEDERGEVEKAYAAIVLRVNALIVVNGEEQYAVFAGEVNQRIKTFSNNMSIREAKRKKKDTNQEDTETKEEEK